MTSSDRCGWMVGLALFLGGSTLAQAGFVIRDLGVIGPNLATAATGISDSGAIAGQMTSSDGTFALVSTAGEAFRLVDTSGLPGSRPTGFDAPYSVATGVNAGGNVVGTYLNYNDGGVQRYHAFATVGGKAVDFGDLAGTTLARATTYGVAINSSGTVLGTAYLGEASTAFRANSPGAVVAITLPGGGTNGVAGGLNNDGTAVGSYVTAQGTRQIFVSSAQGVTTDLLSSYATRGFGLNSYATGIADNGDVVGYGDFNGQSHAFLATASTSSAAGRFTDIGTVGGFSSSKALGLNSFGQVVGSMDSSGFNSHAFLYDGNSSRLYDLNSLLTPRDAQTWTLTTATGINSGSQIVGQGLINGQLHGFLLTPTGGSIFSPSIVPAPPSIILAGAGMVVLSGWCRFRRERTAGRGNA